MRSDQPTRPVDSELVYLRKGFVMKLRMSFAVPAAVLAAGLLLSACGQGGQTAGTASIAVAGIDAGGTTPAAQSSSTAQSSPTAGDAAPTIGLAEAGDLGTVLVAANGLTLYAFANDVDGISTCFDACAAAWPALIVDGGFIAPLGVDPALLSAVDRPDGGKQLKFGSWPLYFFAGDGAPGDTNGQGAVRLHQRSGPTEHLL